MTAVRFPSTAATRAQATRRPASRWADRSAGPPPCIDVLVPTAGRPAELAVTLAGLAAQDDPAFRVLVGDQSDEPAAAQPAVRAMLGVLQAQGRSVEVRRHLPRRGIAEHRDFLLDWSDAAEVLFLDDDVWLEPGSLEVLHDALGELACGFVGMAVQGLSYLDDLRPGEQEPFEEWTGPVTPERVRRDEPSHDRWRLHNAANLAHIAAARHLPPGGWIPYKVAWIGGCVLYDRAALCEAGGFAFWRDLPPDHAGEDARAQWRVMETRGGAGILPSGAVHLEAPTTLPRRSVEATALLE